VKEIYALAEDLRLMVLPDPESLSRVLPPETLLRVSEYLGSPWPA
jgi:hypothetical protein